MGLLVGLVPDIPASVRGWRNNIEIRRWCRQYSLISEAEQENWMKTLHTNHSIKMFGVKSLQGTLVGICGLTSIDRVNQKAEFSLYIAPDYHGEGYGSSALYLILQHGFDDQNLNRIYGESFEGNPAQNLFSKAGMKLEGTFKQSYFREGKFIDSMIWAMTREEFNGRYSSRYGNREQCSGPNYKRRYADSEPVNPSNTNYAGLDVREEHYKQWQGAASKAESQPEGTG
jgi:RimJ/RimL family protein N-acetyltransferase